MKLLLPLLCALGASLLSSPASADVPALSPAALLPAAAAPAAAPVTTHVFWTNADGRLSLWDYSDAGTYTQTTYGPYSGWTPKAVADGPDGRQRILWVGTNGSVSLWSLDNAGGIATMTHAEFGPYAGWSASALSVTPGGGGVTGPAGGDLFGFYPNPTLAPGIVDHTKLASDPASLSQVSGGLLSNTDNYHLDVQHDLIVHGTVVAVQGNGSGVGNNGKAGRALVDGGAGGLIVNFGNDYGRVNVQSELDVQGHLGIDGDIYATNDINVYKNTTVHGIFSSNSIHSADNIDSSTGLIAGVGVISHGFIHADGAIDAKSLQLNGGSDLAEPYLVAASDNAQPLPGMVVAIDPQQTGQMRVCTRAYDTTVGGIISGAGGVSPGITLRQKGSVADGTLPLACTGRVWCWCDAGAGGSITPGDLLTTSDTPGHAMRVRDYSRAQGAIIGKAMSPLKTGKGLVLVLVTLQ